MSPDDVTLGDRLIQVEPQDDELRRRFEEGKLALRERRLTPMQQALGWMGLPLNFGLSFALGRRLLAGETGDPPEFVALQAVSVVGLLVIGAWSLYVLVRGRATWLADRIFQGLAAALTCGLALAAFEVARSLDDPRAAMGMLGVAAVILIALGGGLIVERSRRTALETQVALLENELRVAELARDVAAARPRGGDSPGGIEPR
ncbi:hypothetical protein [Paludisphaera mucosa]|uniref:Uncharacterized protein n=1 Tax=Paludisphaera mucosa TaxID=3030827 RepID=A0ABT6FC72_9BACT|nr:hypothetical protein [Paludisphaera mucosa]MDG3005132.1 hypothetical protein [Paludisphaera mucosa]